MLFFNNQKQKNAGEQNTVWKRNESLSTASLDRPEGIRIVHNMIILDERGSLCSVHRQAIESVNSTLATIRQAQERYPSQKHTVSLMTFNSEQLSLFHVNTPVGNVADMALNEYSPEGCTPHYDAVGKGVTQLRTQVEPYDVVLVTIITDGYENSSVEYTGASIHALIDKMRGEGWVFAFMGANIDVEAVSKSMGIENCLEFERSEVGIDDMNVRHTRSRRKLYDRIEELECDEMPCCKKLDSNFFGE